jgi:hypothetical protein
MTASEYRVADLVTRSVEQRLEDGLRGIEDRAADLMREVATEIWRTSSKDVRPEQERIVTLLSRDQAIRSLISSSDERFQSLAVRTARLEDHLNQLSESTKRTREAMEAAVKSIREIAGSPTLHGVEVVRTQLELVERHIAEAFVHMDEREKMLTETVLRQVKEHGELIAHETTRVVEAMQAYVQSGAEAVGRLAQRIEEHAQMFITQDLHVDETVRAVMDEQTRELTEQLEMVREKVGLFGREQDQLQAAVERLVDARARALAEVVRSDSEALRGLIERRLSEAVVEVRGAVAELGGVVGQLGGLVSELGFDEDALLRAVTERMGAMEQIVSERMGSLERSVGDQMLALSAAMSGSIDRNLERMSTAAGALDGMDEMIAETQQAFEERMMAHVDERLTAVARLIRSDNQVLASKVQAVEAAATTGLAQATAAAAAAAAAPAPAASVDPELLRQVLRAIKELQAGMASDMMGTMDRRFQVMSDQLHRETQMQTEAMAKVAEVLSNKIERLSVRVDEGVGGDLQVVIDRMSDAIRAMSAQRREAS